MSSKTPGTMMDFPLTLTTIVARAAQIFPSVEVVSRRPDRSLHRSTWGEVMRRARSLAAALQATGLQSGDRVATLMWNHSFHLETYFGIPLACGVIHTLNARLHGAELAYIVNHAADRFLIVDDTLLPILETFRAKVKLERIFVVRHDAAKPAPASTEDYESFLASAPASFTPPPIHENDAAAMCFTSGTTGNPKGVLYSHRSIVLHSFGEALVDTFAFGHLDTLMVIPPMFHANGWGFPYTAAMVGAKLVLPGLHYDAENLLDLLAGEQVTATGGVPTIWLSIVEALDAHPGRWKLTPGLRAAAAGSAVPESLIRRMDQHGIRAMQLWGMTETAPLATISLPASHMREWHADKLYALRAKQGRPTPFMEIRAVNVEGEIPWDGQALGELHVRGPWVAASYHNMPEAADRWTPDGWFRTGDVVSIDSDGYIKIADRSKDLIKSGGEWISSVDLENALMAHPAVKEACVVGIPHPKWDERPLAAIVLKDGCRAKPEELREFLSAKFAKWQLPEAFVFLNAIPRTSVGKFRKSTLRDQFANWKWEE